MDSNKIGRFIAERRHALGYTQQELGERLDVTDRAVSKWERGISCPDLPLLDRLAVELRVRLTELLHGEPDSVASSFVSSRNDDKDHSAFIAGFGRDLDLSTLGEPGGVVSPCLFGENLEHTRSSIFQGLSAQMLRNRKFAGKPAAMNGAAAEWFAIGAHTFCAQVKPAYTRHGESCHMRRRNECWALQVSLFREAGVCGVGQHGLSIAAGVPLEFAAVVRGKKKTALTVCLTDRSGERVLAKTTLSLPGGGEWTRLTAPLTPAEGCEDADLRITFDAPGCVIFGALSLLPADNFHGMRRDVVAHMKEMGISILRWPGGNFAGEYNWFDGLLPVDERAPFESYLGLETQPHSTCYDNHELNTDDFIALCREIGAEPFLTINAAWNTPEENAAWVEYCNGGPDTKYGALRAERGHAEPYRVMLWSLGNEAGYGHMEGDNSADGYNRLARENAMKMRAVTPNLSFCASGPYPSSEFARGFRRHLGGVASLASLHIYVKEMSWDDPDNLRAEYERCLGWVDMARAKLREMRATFDALGCPCGISFDEWNVWAAWYRPSNLPEGIFAALMLTMLIDEAPKSGVDLVCHFEAVNESCIRVLPHDSYLTAQGQMFAMMQHHKNGILRHVSDRAVVTEKDGTLTVTLVNASFDRPMAVTLPAAPRAGTLYTGDTLWPDARFDETPLPTGKKADATLTLPPHSAALLFLDAGH